MLLFLLLFVWGISALVAGAIAGDRDRSFFGFAAVTFFFLGPLGPGFALIATHGRIEKAQLQASGWPMKRPVTPKVTKPPTGTVKTKRELLAESLKEADKAAEEAQSRAEAARARLDELRRQAETDR